ncbi:tyrosine-type recombinase/integrase [Robertmurraya massiliosenegalensis]|uniref:tyrosine-type recombinase/integrase n=1 Tax=Robertmurraya TaxID=2837507 RepID=UPI0039A5DA7B
MNLNEILLNDLQDMLDIKEALGFNKKSYEVYLKQFIHFCAEHYGDSSYITKEMVIEWIRLRPRESINTRNRRVIALRHFTEYQATIGRQTFILNSDYNLPAQPYKPYLFTDHELSILFHTIDKISPYWESPQREFTVPVLFRMMYCCGMRPNEPLNLKHTDVSLDTGEIYIRQSKRCKDRHIYMSDDLLVLSRKYDDVMGNREFFFQRPEGGPYTTHWMTNQFKICLRNSNLDFGTDKLRPYDFRHNFATRTIIKWLEAKKDIMALLPYLSAYMGHSAFNYTLYYIHLLPERLIHNSGIRWEDFSDIYPEATK